MIRRTLAKVQARRVSQRTLTRRMLDALAGVAPRARFVEIGANDGEQHDHLSRYLTSTEWSGVMVEPVDYIFERLRDNHGDNPRVMLERAVISDVDGTVPFFYLAPPRDDERSELPDWYDGIGSLSRAAVLSHRPHIPDIDDRLVCGELPSMTMDTLCEKVGFEDFDLLVVDTEGYDAELLAGVDLHRYQPRLIIYEHFHLAARDRRACAARLADHGYRCVEEGFDTICLRDGGRDSLQAAWERNLPALPGIYADSAGLS